MCHIPPCISSSQWIWSCWSTADNTWSWGCRWHNGRDWRWIQWWLTQQVTTTCWTLSAIRQQNIYTCLQLPIPWQKSRNLRNITTFLGLATTLSEKALCWNELWATHDPEGKNLSGIQHAQHTLKQQVASKKLTKPISRNPLTLLLLLYFISSNNVLLATNPLTQTQHCRCQTSTCQLTNSIFWHTTWIA